MPNTSVIITTYNSPRALELVLWGYACQDSRAFELVVADDGSTAETACVVERFRQKGKRPLQHVWHEDLGFRKTMILNKAIQAARHEYLLFTDGDCIPRRNFVSQHQHLAAVNRFLSGGMLRLPPQVSEVVDLAAVTSGRATDLAWLREVGLPWSLPALRLASGSRLAPWFDRFTTTRPTFNGHNTSAWKADILRVNGFDERMVYGGLDRELGERLCNAGVKPRQIRHRAVCVHLYHDRPYRTEAGMTQNEAIRATTRRRKLAWTEYGISRAGDAAADHGPLIQRAA